MAGIDETRPFYPFNIAVLTVSDMRDLSSDTSGQYLADSFGDAEHRLAGRAIVHDEVEAIRTQVRQWVDDPGVDVIISTGGTGFSSRDVTPEAVRPMFRREMDSFIFCLSGSTGGCRDGDWGVS